MFLATHEQITTNQKNAQAIMNILREGDEWVWPEKHS